MHIPVELGSRREARVYPREEEARDGGGDIAEDNLIEREGCRDFVEVQRQRLHVEEVRDGLYIFDQALRRRNRERIVHRGSRVWGAVDAEVEVEVEVDERGVMSGR